MLLCAHTCIVEVRELGSWGGGGEGCVHRKKLRHGPNQFWKDTVNQMHCCLTHNYMVHLTITVLLLLFSCWWWWMNWSTNGHARYWTDRKCDKLWGGGGGGVSRGGGELRAILGMTVTACNEAQQHMCWSGALEYEIFHCCWHWKEWMDSGYIMQNIEPDNDIAKGNLAWQVECCCTQAKSSFSCEDCQNFSCERAYSLLAMIFSSDFVTEHMFRGATEQQPSSLKLNFPNFAKPENSFSTFAKPEINSKVGVRGWEVGMGGWVESWLSVLAEVLSVQTVQTIRWLTSLIQQNSINFSSLQATAHHRNFQPFSLKAKHATIISFKGYVLAWYAWQVLGENKVLKKKVGENKVSTPQKKQEQKQQKPTLP